MTETPRFTYSRPFGADYEKSGGFPGGVYRDETTGWEYLVIVRRYSDNDGMHMVLMLMKEISPYVEFGYSQTCIGPRLGLETPPVDVEIALRDMLEKNCEENGITMHDALGPDLFRILPSMMAEGEPDIG